MVRLTREGLTEVPDKKENSYRNNFVSDDVMNCKKSAEAIVIQMDEGLTIVILRTVEVLELQIPQAMPNGGYLQKNMMESEGTVKACSNSCGEADRRDGVTRLIYEVVDRENLNIAYKKVKANKGAAGVDGMTVCELHSYLIKNRNELTRQIADGSYKPKPVKRVEIPKPNGTKRKLGIPTVVDRMYNRQSYR